MKDILEILETLGRTLEGSEIVIILAVYLLNKWLFRPFLEMLERLLSNQEKKTHALQTMESVHLASLAESLKGIHRHISCDGNSKER